MIRQSKRQDRFKQHIDWLIQMPTSLLQCLAMYKGCAWQQHYVAMGPTVKLHIHCSSTVQLYIVVFQNCNLVITSSHPPAS